MKIHLLDKYGKVLNTIEASRHPAFVVYDGKVHQKAEKLAGGYLYRERDALFFDCNEQELSIGA